MDAGVHLLRAQRGPSAQADITIPVPRFQPKSCNPRLQSDDPGSPASDLDGLTTSGEESCGHLPVPRQPRHGRAARIL